MRRALHAVALTLLLFLSASAALAQGSYPLASPVSTNRFGQPIKATVAICTGNPGTSVTGCAGNLVTTYTDITDTVPCSGPAGTQFLNNQANASVGSGCSNPGTTDSSGNVLAFAASGNYWCQYYGSQIVTYVMPCQFGSIGTGGGSLGPITTGFIPVAGTGLTPSLLNSSLIENGQLVRTPEPMQAYSFTSTCTDCGIDMTGGDGSNLGQLAGNQHSYLWTDKNSNYAIRYQPNGGDPIFGGIVTPEFLAVNPMGPRYEVDGVRYTSTCGLLQSLPANSIVTVHSHILENFTCNPFTAVSGLVLQLYLDPQPSCYTADVPITLTKTSDRLIGESRGRSGAAIYHGVCIAPSATYNSTNNPFVSAVPSGFTISATTSGCTNFIPAGTYMVGITWGPDQNRESVLAQETAVTLDGATNCFRVVHPGSPPANVTRYNVYICHQNGCGSGTELWQQQLAIASDFTLNSSTFASGSGSPPHVNTTGAFIALASLSAASASATNVIFGTRVENLSIDGSVGGLAVTGVTGLVEAANFNAEEESGFDTIDFNETCGTVSVYYGFYSIGLGASNSFIHRLSLNNGSICNPSVAGIYLDSIETFRGLDDFTDTQGSVPICVFASGSSLQPVSGTSISNGHLEKCGTEGVELEGFHGRVANVTCSPTNIARCVHNDASSTIVYEAIRGGSSDNPISDDLTGFVSAKSYEPFYTNSFVGYPTLIVGPTPTSCTWTNTAGTITCAFATGSSNALGKMNLNTAAPQGLSGTVAINFSGTFGVNGGLCHLQALDQAGIWTLPTSFAATAIGTGQWVGKWQAGGNLTAGTTYAVTYQCGPF